MNGLMTILVSNLRCLSSSFSSFSQSIITFELLFRRIYYSFESFDIIFL